MTETERLHRLLMRALHSVAKDAREEPDAAILADEIRQELGWPALPPRRDLPAITPQQAMLRKFWLEN